jgi:hypothetical protein
MEVHGLKNSITGVFLLSVLACAPPLVSPERMDERSPALLAVEKEGWAIIQMFQIAQNQQLLPAPAAEEIKAHLERWGVYQVRANTSLLIEGGHYEEILERMRTELEAAKALLRLHVNPMPGSSF